MIPVYGFVEGDTLGILVLAQPHFTMAELATRLQQAARVRVKPFTGARVRLRGEVLDPGRTLEEAGIEPLERFDVIRSGVPDAVSESGDSK